MGIVFADGSEGAYTNIVGDETFVKTEGSMSYTLSGDGGYYFTAELINSDGKVQSNAVSSSSGNLSSTDFKRTLSVSAPKVAGDYRLHVIFYDTSSKTTMISDKYVPLKVVEPVKLSAKLVNTGDVSVTMTVYFVVNGMAMSGSEQTVTIDANGEKDVKYEYVVKDLRWDNVYYIDSKDSTVSTDVKGLGEGSAAHFYTHANDYTWLVSLVIIILVLLVIILIYIYRKPVKNLGKPKARR